MPIGDLAGMLFETLRTQRLRSFLTILGIVIGISSVVLLSSIGEGTRAGIASQFSQFGTTIVSILPGKEQTFGRGPGYMGGTTHPLRLEDAFALKRIAGVRYIAPNCSGISEVKSPDHSRRTYIYGVLHEGQYVWQWRPRVGTFIPEGDPEFVPPVCVLGSKTAGELFPEVNPLGAHVHVGGVRFTVTGVMEPKGQMMGFDIDDAVYVPVRRAMRLFNRDEVQEIHIYVTSHSMIDRVVKEAKQLLIARHGGEEDFTIFSQADALSVIDEVMTVLTVGVLVIAAIAVFVGAMGILTIMWISVHERTAEIGLTKALGASDRQVLILFLAEAATISLIGGALGMAVGAGGSWLLGSVVPSMWIQVPVLIVPVSLGVSLTVGIVAGIVPAVRAARLDPVEALRAE